MRITFVVLLVLAVAFAPASSAQQINAAGATFPAPIYLKWFKDFMDMHHGWKIIYQPIGSGAGIRQLIAGAVDIGASDAPLSAEQIAAFQVEPLHFPTVLGGVVPIYNLPDITDDLRFTPDVLAGIFMGTITKWNDPRAGIGESRCQTA